MQKIHRCPITGQFIKPQINIVAGRLYAFKGVPVRATKTGVVLYDNNGKPQTFRKVVSHKVLEGFVPEAELTLISKKAVNSYIEKA